MTTSPRPPWPPRLVEPGRLERVPLRRLTSWDACRCYVLFDEVDCNIPRWGTEGEPGAWDHARGLLVELCRWLDATAVSLRYRELETPVARNLIGIEVTAVADRDGRRVVVVSRTEYAPYGARGDYWCLTVNNETREAWRAVYPPSLPFIANLVRRYLNTEAGSEATQSR